jgi:hypothetical protein
VPPAAERGNRDSVGPRGAKEQTAHLLFLVKLGDCLIVIVRLDVTLHVRVRVINRRLKPRQRLFLPKIISARFQAARRAGADHVAARKFKHLPSRIEKDNGEIGATEYGELFCLLD